jgi:hypothetical protein
MKQISTSTPAEPGDKEACGMCVLETGDESPVSTTVRLILSDAHGDGRYAILNPKADYRVKYLNGRAFQMCRRHAAFWESASVELTVEEATVWGVMER